MLDLKFNTLIGWIFYGALTFMGARGVGTLDKMESSVSSLNEKVALMIHTTSKLEMQVEKNAERIRALELERYQKKHSSEK